MPLREEIQGGSKLLTKNTAIKMNYQGSGYSHEIKDFFEEVADENGLESIEMLSRVHMPLLDSLFMCKSRD